VAAFKYKNGISEIIEIEDQFKNTRLFLNVKIVLANNDFKIAGHSIIFFNNNLLTQDVQFDNLPLGFAFSLNGTDLKLKVDVSKFKVETGDIAGTNEKAECVVSFDAGNTLIREVKMDDGTDIEENSVFNFLFTIKLK
jgi:hypothetical protein